MQRVKLQMNLSMFDYILGMGKWIGLFFGFLFGHAPGALLGFVIGTIFDRAFNNLSNQTYLAYASLKNKEQRALFLDAMFATMGYIAKIDGRVSEQELTIALEVMRRFNLSTEQMTRAKASFSHGKSLNFSLEQVISELNYNFATNRALLNLFLVIQYEVAIRGGTVSAKIYALNTLFKGLGFASIFEQPGYFYQEQSTQSKPYVADDSPYKILGINLGASQKEIKTAYRRLISKYHPDKLIASGASDKEITAANLMSQKIINAYEQLRRD